MNILNSFNRNSIKRRVIASVALVAFFLNTFAFPAQRAYAQEALTLPAPGVRIGLSPEFAPSILKGIKVYPNNPFRFDFILDKGNSSSDALKLKEESNKLVKYFLAALTVPEKDLWVNLSPYEKDRIIPDAFGMTEMGRDLLAQDYILKQITASVIYPEEKTGKEFWDRVYTEAQKKFGTTDIPIDTFNKVWIVPEKAVVYENNGSAFVIESSLKVLLEQDYLALQKNTDASNPKSSTDETNKLGSEIVREVVIPILTKEVNEGKNFAQLRQVYHSLVLAAWYKRKIKESILDKVYVDQKKVAGVDVKDKTDKDKIYAQYVKAFKKGVYNYIKEDYDPATQEVISRKYFSGGAEFTDLAMASALQVKVVDRAEIVRDVSGSQKGPLETVVVNVNPVGDDPNAEGRRSNGEGAMKQTAPVISEPSSQDTKGGVRQLREEEYLASKEEQERVFDQISDQIIVDQGKQLEETSKMAREVFRDVLRAAGLNPDAYQLLVLNDETSNAFIIPYTTRAYINVGLIREVATLPAKSQRGALAFVLGHEITHIAQYRKRVEQGVVPTLSDFKIEEYIKRHIERYTDEYGADANALFLVNKAGYSVRYATSLFEKWEKANGKKGEVSTPWGSHPKLSQRIIEIKKAMRKASWRSWSKEQSFSDEVLSELPKASQHEKFVSRVERFSGQRLEERFRHMDELLNMVNEAPDYEALLFVLQHIFYYTTNFFQEHGILNDGSYRGSEDSYRNTNFTDRERKTFVEESMSRFLKRAAELRTGVNNRVFEQEVVNVFAQRTKFVKHFSVDVAGIFLGAQFQTVDVDAWVSHASIEEKLSFIEFGYPYAMLKQSKTLQGDYLAGSLFGFSDYERSENILDFKKKVIDSIIKEVEKNGNYDLARQTLISLRMFYHKHPDNYFKAWLLSVEGNLMEACLTSLRGNKKRFKEELFNILSLYQILPYHYDLEIKEDAFREIYDLFFVVFKNDPEGWEQLVSFMVDSKNKRIYKPLRYLSFGNRGWDSKKTPASRLPMAAIFEDVDRNIRMLAAFWKINDKSDILGGDAEQFLKNLDYLQAKMGIKGSKEKIAFLLKASKVYQSSKTLYSGSEDGKLYMYDHNNAIEQEISKALQEMSSDERDVYFQESLRPVFEQLGITGFDALSPELKTLAFLYYFVGPVPLDVFFDEEGVFNLKAYFYLTKSKYDSTELPRKGKVPDHFDINELYVFVNFLRGIAGHMNTEFQVPLRTDLTFSEKDAEAVEKDGTVLKSLMRDKVLAISTWPEYVQVVSNYVESRNGMAGMPSLAESRERHGGRLNLFWGESLGHKTTEDLMEDLQKQWFEAEKGESAVYRYSRHAHGKVINGELEELYDEIPVEKNHEVLSWFDALEQSPQSFKEWEEKIVANYEPSVFRNYFLYAVFVYKVLKQIPGFDMTRAFDLRYLKEFLGALDEQKQGDVREMIASLNNHTTYDWRVEAFNLGIVAIHLSSLKSAAGDVDVSKRIQRRNMAVRELKDTNEVLYMTPGGPESQLDLLIPLMDEKHLASEIKRADRSFEDKLEILLKAMPKRRNSEFDRFLQMILDTTKLTLQEAQALLDIKKLKGHFSANARIQSLLEQNLDIEAKDDNQSVFHSPLLRDKVALETLEREFTEQSESFTTLDGELSRVVVYFPSFSPMRDGILKAVVKRRVEDPNALAKAEKFLMESRDNIDKEEIRRRIFGRDVVMWLMSKTSLDTRRMFLEWLLGWRMTKPADLVEFENRYMLNLEPLRDQLLKVKDGQVYSGVRDHVIREFIQTAIDGFIENDSITEEFAAQMLHAIIPRGVGEKTFRIYQGIMDAILSSKFNDRKKEILTALAMEWIDIQLSEQELSMDEIEARMIGTFFQANGFMGVKLAQVLSSTTAFDIPELIRKRMAVLKSEAKPIEKGVAIKVLDEVLPGGFYAHFKRLIGEPVGSASLKVVYLAEDLKGNIVLVKIKRTEVVVELEEDINFLSELIAYIQPFVQAAGVQIPDNLVETVKSQLLDELDFEKEKRDQLELGSILASRGQKNKYNMRVPEGYEVYENMVFVEEFIDGILLAKSDRMEEQGYDLAKIRKALKYELLTQLFVDGVFHLDPHAGNIIGQDNTDVVFIDNSIGRLSSKLRMPLLAFLMHAYPKKISRIAANYMGWDLRRVLVEFNKGEQLSVEAMDALVEKFERQIVQSKEGSVANRVVNAITLLEENGIVLDKEVGAVKKFFSAADYLLSDIRLADAPFLYRLVRQVKNQYKSGSASAQATTDSAMFSWQDFVAGGIKENPAWAQDPVYQRFRDHGLGDSNTDPVGMVSGAKRAMEDFGIKVQDGGVGLVLGFGRKGIGEVELGKVRDDFGLKQVHGVDWVDYRVREVAEGLREKGYNPQEILLHHANMNDLKGEIQDGTIDLVYGFGLEGIGLLDVDRNLASELVRILAPAGVVYLLAKPGAEALAVLNQSGEVFRYSEKSSVFVFKKNGTKGGIDFNTDKMNLQVQNGGEAIRFNVDPAMLQRLQNATGFSPVIIDIHPTTSLPQFLGMKENVEVEQISMR